MSSTPPETPINNADAQTMLSTCHGQSTSPSTTSFTSLITEIQEPLPNRPAIVEAACAACKHQRHKCDVRNCIFRPYFPGLGKDEFVAVNQIFGFIKAKKLLQNCSPGIQRRQRADEIKWLANMLTKPLSDGPLMYFNRLVSEIHQKDQLINELRNQIGFYQANNVGICSICDTVISSNFQTSQYDQFLNQQPSPSPIIDGNNGGGSVPNLYSPPTFKEMGTETEALLIDGDCSLDDLLTCHVVVSDSNRNMPARFL